MQDPKFEQEVQRKMHDLEFVPSDSVWTVIQEGIGPRKRRRAVAVIWWLFPGMVLLAGGVVMYRHSASTRAVVTAVPVRAGNAASGGSGTDGAAKVGGGSAAKVDDGSVGKVDGGSAAKVSDGSGNEVLGNEAEGTGDAAESSGKGRGSAGDAAGQRAAGFRFHPGLVRGMANRAGVQGPWLNWRPANTAVAGITQPRHPWRAGFAAGGGASSIYSGSGNALVATSVSGAASGNYFLPASSAQRPPALYSNATASTSKQNETNVRVSYSYWAGVYGEKPLSSRWSVDIGLNLHYYSLRFQTLSQSNAYAPTAASLIAPSVLTYTLNSANGYATETEQTYVNSYYFLEVPATVQWRLNQSRSLPLFWRGGVVLSYLASSNGLYYDASSDTYKKDNGVVRRTQAGVQSGLMMGIPLGGVQLQAGPEIQYALTSMLTAGSGGGHMVYGGVRLAVMR